MISVKASPLESHNAQNSMPAWFLLLLSPGKVSSRPKLNEYSYYTWQKSSSWQRDPNIINIEH